MPWTNVTRGSTQREESIFAKIRTAPEQHLAWIRAAVRNDCADPVSPAAEAGPGGGVRLEPGRHAGLGRRPVALALVARPARGHSVQPRVLPAPRTRQDVVDGRRPAAAVRAVAAVALVHARAGPGRPGRVAPAGHDVLHEPDNGRHREDTEPYVGLRFMHDRDPPAQHP